MIQNTGIRYRIQSIGIQNKEYRNTECKDTEYRVQGYKIQSRGIHNTDYGYRMQENRTNIDTEKRDEEMKKMKNEETRKG